MKVYIMTGLEGVRRGSAAGLDGAAIHLHPTRAREQIRDAATRAVKRRAEISLFRLQAPLSYLPEHEASRKEGLCRSRATRTWWQQLVHRVSPSSP